MLIQIHFHPGRPSHPKDNDKGGARERATASKGRRGGRSAQREAWIKS